MRSYCSLPVCMCGCSFSSLSWCLRFFAALLFVLRLKELCPYPSLTLESRTSQKFKGQWRKLRPWSSSQHLYVIKKATASQVVSMSPFFLQVQFLGFFSPSLPHHVTQPLHDEGYQAFPTLEWLIPTH